jgi:hypothetical protein
VLILWYYSLRKCVCVGTFQTLLHNHNFAFCYEACGVLMRLHAVASFSVSSLCETVFWYVIRIYLAMSYFLWQFPLKLFSVASSHWISSGLTSLCLHYRFMYISLGTLHSTAGCLSVCLCLYFLSSVFCSFRQSPPGPS